MMMIQIKATGMKWRHCMGMWQGEACAETSEQYHKILCDIALKSLHTPLLLQTNLYQDLLTDRWTDRQTDGRTDRWTLGCL